MQKQVLLLRFLIICTGSGKSIPVDFVRFFDQGFRGCVANLAMSILMLWGEGQSFKAWHLGTCLGVSALGWNAKLSEILKPTATSTTSTPTPSRHRVVEIPHHDQVGNLGDSCIDYR